MIRVLLLSGLLLIQPVAERWEESNSFHETNTETANALIPTRRGEKHSQTGVSNEGSTGARSNFGLSTTLQDHTSSPPRQTDPNAPSVSGILDYSPFRYLGHINPGGPYDDNTRIWGDVYGYNYDGDDSNFKGKSFSYVGVDVRGTGMSIFDVTDPANPLHVGTYGSQVFRDVEIHDGIGYFSGGSVTHIVDLRVDPVHPPLLKIVAGSHEFNVDNATTGRFLYVDDFAGSIPIYDVTTPRTPDSIVLKKTLTTSGGHSVFAQGGRAYVANGRARTLAIYDVSDILNGNAPLITEFPTDGGLTHGSWPVGNGDYLYVTHESGGTDLRVYDMSGTRLANGNIDEIESSRVPYTALGAGFVANVHNLFVVGDLLFTSWTEAGMVLFNIADPSVPVLIGTFDTEATNSGANFNGDFGVYPGLGLDRVQISDRTTGLWLIDVTNVVSGVSEPKTLRSFALHQNWPNPFNQSTTIAFDLSEPAEIRVRIYNIVGQRIRTLFVGSLGKGEHRLVWDGRDDAGLEVATGTYLLNLKAEELKATRKLLLLR